MSLLDFPSESPASLHNNNPSDHVSEPSLSSPPGAEEPLHDLLQVLDTFSPGSETGESSAANPASVASSCPTSVSSAGSEQGTHEEQNAQFNSAKNIDELFSLLGPGGDGNHQAAMAAALAEGNNLVMPDSNNNNGSCSSSSGGTPTTTITSTSSSSSSSFQGCSPFWNQMTSDANNNNNNKIHEFQQIQQQRSVLFPDMQQQQFAYPPFQMPQQQTLMMQQQQQVDNNPFCVNTLLSSEEANQIQTLSNSVPKPATLTSRDAAADKDGDGGVKPFNRANRALPLPLPLSLTNPAFGGEDGDMTGIKSEPMDEPMSASEGSVVWSFDPRAPNGGNGMLNAVSSSSPDTQWIKREPSSMVSSMYPNQFNMFVLPSLPSAPLPRDQLLPNPMLAGFPVRRYHRNGTDIMHHSVSMTFAPAAGGIGLLHPLGRPPYSNPGIPAAARKRQPGVKKERREPNRLCPLPWCAVRDCRNYNIKRHFVTRHLEREPRFHCPVCRSQAGTLVTFSLEQDVRRHLVNVHHMENLTAAKMYLDDLRRTGYVVGQRDTSSATEGIKELLRKGETEFPGVGKLRKDEAHRLHLWLAENREI